MTNVFRARIFNQGFVEASAEKTWAALSDWAGVVKLRTPGSSKSPLAVDRVELEGDPESTPRTRVFYFKSPDLPEVRETLLYKNDEVRHLYYNIEGVGPAGLINYLATTDVDEISDAKCLVTITARFDVPDGADIVQAKSIINVAHTSVIAGLNAYCSKQ